MKPEEIEAKFKEFQSQVDAVKTQAELTRKDFELKLESAKKDVDQYRSLAEKREEDLRKFREESEKTKREAEETIAKARKQEIASFTEALKKAGRITPAQEEIMVKLMESMTSEAVVMKFKESDGSEKSHTLLSLFKLFVSGLRKQMNLAQETPGSRVAPITPFQEDEEGEHFMDVQSKAGGTQKMPVHGFELNKKAEEYMEQMRIKGQFISFADALLAVAPRRQKTQA